MALPVEPSATATLPAVPPDVTLTPVRSSADKIAFIRMVYPIYQGDPNWVPPLISEMEFILGEENPFFHHAEAAYFLATESGNTVGRIAAIIDRNHINTHNEQAGFFGFFESIADQEVANLLLAGVCDWLRGRGITKVIGPMNPSTNDECGLLIDGFDISPCLMMPYNPPYYTSLFLVAEGWLPGGSGCRWSDRPHPGPTA